MCRLRSGAGVQVGKFAADEERVGWAGWHVIVDSECTGTAQGDPAGFFVHAGPGENIRSASPCTTFRLVGC
jgi:hypothetical protein